MQPNSRLIPFTLKEPDGKLWQSKSAAGKILVLNFWSAECPWSKKVDQLLPPHLKEWGDRVIYAAVACNTNEPIELIRTAALERQLPLVLLDEQQKLANQMGAMTTPHFFVFDSQGLLQYQGGFDDTSFRVRIAYTTGSGGSRQ